MNFAKVINTSLTAVALASLTGCAGFKEVSDQVARDTDAGRAHASDMQPASKSLPSSIRVKPRIAGEQVVRERNAMPAVFSQPFTYRTNGGQTLQQVAQSLASQLGMQVRVLHEVGATGGAGSPSSRLATAPAIVLDWRDKPVAGLFDLIAQQHGLFWRYTGDRGVEFFELESRTFHVNVPSGVKRVDATISLGSGGASGGGAPASAAGAGAGGGGSGGGGSVNIASATEIDPYRGMMDSINAMLQADEGEGQAAPGAARGGAAGAAGGQGGSATASRGAGGRMIASPELGIITVTARPPTLERIATYIEAVNKRYAQNVQIDLSIYSVRIARQNQAGFSADIVYRNLASNGVRIVGNPILTPQSGVPSQLTLEAGSGRFAGSKLVMQALQGLGDVALVTTGHVMAINGQPSPIQVADQITYLASSTTTTAPNVGTTTTLQPGTVTAGFTGNFLPLILSDNRILLQYQLQLSNATLSTVTSGNASIQTPVKSEQSLQQQAYVRDGQTIVLMSFEQRRGSDDRQLGLLGASTSANSERNLLVVVMQVSTRGVEGERV